MILEKIDRIIMALHCNSLKIHGNCSPILFICVLLAPGQTHDIYCDMHHTPYSTVFIRYRNITKWSINLQDWCLMIFYFSVWLPTDFLQICQVSSLKLGLHKPYCATEITLTIMSKWLLPILQELRHKSKQNNAKWYHAFIKGCILYVWPKHYDE